MTKNMASGLLSLAVLCLAGLVLGGAADARERVYPWLDGNAKARETIAQRIAPPAGFARVPAQAGSFADWLRHLPLKPRGAPVRLHDGRLKRGQNNHAAVTDLDIGKRDLQQCADAVMRLRAEYLYSLGRYRAIAFNFTSGDRAAFARWAGGWRPRIRGRDVRWVRTGRTGTDHRNFRNYLNTVFTYAGSYSLSRELKPIADPDRLKIGDVFIEGGFPGHAVVIVDLAVESRTGRKVFLLAQSFMPAQSLHILKNAVSPKLGAWYEVSSGARLATPDWTFRTSHLRRF